MNLELDFGEQRLGAAETAKVSRNHCNVRRNKKSQRKSYFDRPRYWDCFQRQSSHNVRQKLLSHCNNIQHCLSGKCGQIGIFNSPVVNSDDVHRSKPVCRSIPGNSPIKLNYASTTKVGILSKLRARNIIGHANRRLCRYEQEIGHDNQLTSSIWSGGTKAVDTPFG